MREERERLGRSQREVWEACEVSKPTYLRWEKRGHPIPSDKLARLAALGMDILYLVTGQRSSAADDVGSLNAEERDVVQAYRGTDDAGRHALHTLARWFLSHLPPKGRRG